MAAVAPASVTLPVQQPLPAVVKCQAVPPPPLPQQLPSLAASAAGLQLKYPLKRTAKRELIGAIFQTVKRSTQRVHILKHIKELIPVRSLTGVLGRAVSGALLGLTS